MVIMVQSYNPSNLGDGVRQEDCLFQYSLGYIVRTNKLIK